MSRIYVAKLLFICGAVTTMGATARSDGDYFWAYGGIEEGDWYSYHLPIFSEINVPTRDEGDYFAEALGDDGIVLYKQFFNLENEPLSEGPDNPKFSVLLPARADISKINLRSSTSNGILYQYDFDTHTRPSVDLLSYPSGTLDGDYLVAWSSAGKSDNFYRLSYSYDNGAPGTWIDVTNSNDIRGTTDTSLSIDSDLLRGSTSSSKIRVIARNGLNYAVDTSGSFFVPMKPPEIEIVSSPSRDQPFYVSPEGAPSLNWVVQVGGIDGYHIPEENYVWRSSIDGFLGRGDSYSTRGLSLGSHNLSVEVTALNGEVYTLNNVGEFAVVNQKPELKIRVGDGTQSDLACNEVEVDVQFFGVPISEVRYAFNNYGAGKSNVIVDESELPIRYLMTEDTRVNTLAANVAALYSVYDKVIELKNCKSDDVNNE